MSQKAKNIIVIIVVFFDVILWILSCKIDLFKILIHHDNNSYEVNNSNLMFAVGISVISVLVIYHFIISKVFSNQSKTFSEHLDTIDKSGHVREGIKKIEVHLMNYNSDTVAFKHLSAIENEVGIAKEDVHNEIWILTNSFEEKNDSREGKELREAIISNLKTNVNYYYVIPKSAVDEIDQLAEKLRAEIGKQKINGKFQYITDDALDFIPTPYFDIIMYIKIGVGKKEFAESSSQIYYCFSRSRDSEDCYYQKVDSKDIWNRMTKHTKKYKKEKKGFKTIV